MILSDNDIRELIKQPKNGAALREAVRMEAELNALANGENQSIILDRFCNLFVPEMETTIYENFAMHAKPFLAIDSGTIYSHFQKIHNTQESYSFDFIFGDDKEYLDYFLYSGNIFNPANTQKFDGENDVDFFAKEVTALALYRPNTKLIVDFPANSTETKPYISLADIRECHDYEEQKGRAAYLIVSKHYKKDKDGKLTLQLTQTGANYTEYFVYDEVSYQKWVQENSVLNLVSYNEHSFGSCPVQTVSDYRLHSKYSIVRKSQITDSLADIYDYTLVSNIFKWHNWQKGTPASIGISTDNCDYIFYENKQSCNGEGFAMLDLTSKYYGADYTGERLIRKVNCPKCEARKKEKQNFGRQVNIKSEHIFNNGETNEKMLAVLKDSLGPIEVNISYLEYAPKWLKEKETKIKSDITGEGLNLADKKEAFNEKQIGLSTDDKQNNLSVFAQKIEGLHNWAVSAICKSRYFSFVRFSVFYGRSYFLKSTQEQLNEYIELSSKTGNQFLIAQKGRDLINAQYQHNQSEKEMGLILQSVIPFSELPTENVLPLLQNFAFNQEQIFIRLFASVLIPEYRDIYYPKLQDYRFATKLEKSKKWFSDKVKELVNPQNLNNLDNGSKNNSTNNGGDDSANPNGQPNTGE